MYLTDGSAQTILRAATLRQKLHIKRCTSPSHSMLTPGRPVPVLTLERQAPGRVATGVTILKSLVWLDPEKIPAQAGFEPGILRSRGGHLTTRPTWRLSRERDNSKDKYDEGDRYSREMLPWKQPPAVVSSLVAAPAAAPAAALWPATLLPSPHSPVPHAPATVGWRSAGYSSHHGKCV